MDYLVVISIKPGADDEKLFGFMPIVLLESKKNLDYNRVCSSVGTKALFASELINKSWPELKKKIKPSDISWVRILPTISGVAIALGGGLGQ